MRWTTENKLICLISLLGLVTALLVLFVESQSKNGESLLVKDNMREFVERKDKYYEDQDQVVTEVQDDEDDKDEQWKQQEIRYNFTCMHKQIGKNYEALVINNPGTPAAPTSQLIVEKQLKDSSSRSSQSTQTKKQLPKHHKNPREDEQKQQANPINIEHLNEIDDSEGFRDLDAASDQIKISLDYSGMMQKQENKQKINYIQQRLLPEVITSIIEMISVKKDKVPGAAATSQLNGNPNNVKSVVIPYGQCFRTKVPTLHATTGINTDLILYVTNIKEGNNKIWGVVCVRDFGQNFRPVAAQLNIDEELVLEENHGFNVKALTHELVHILGFSERSLSLSKNNKDVFVFDDNNKKMLSLSVLKNYAQTYYNCSQKIAGLPLEDYNLPQNGTSALPTYFSESTSNPESANTQEIHFEKTLLMNDLMTAEIMSNSQLSPLSLKVLESTGWYNVKLEHALNFHFLLNAGCLPLLNFTNFYEQATNKTTPPAVDKNSTNEIPTKNSTTANQTLLGNQALHQLQHSQYLSKHIRSKDGSFSQAFKEETNSDSDLTKNKKIIPKFNKYNNGLLGYCDESEFNQIARGCSYDFCFKSVCKRSLSSNNLSYLQPLESGTCLKQADSASNPAANFTKIGEKFSRQSYCFISDLNRPSNLEKQNTIVETARCYQAECDSVLKFVTISVFDKTIQCFSDFQIISNPSGLIGEFHCPNITDFCLAFDLRKYRFKNKDSPQLILL